MNDTGQDVAVEAGPNGPENVCAPFLNLSTDTFLCLLSTNRIMTWTTPSATTSARPGTTLGTRRSRTSRSRSRSTRILLGSRYLASLNMGTYACMRFRMQIQLITLFVCSGILNQEAQTVDNQGRIHVLNRENTSDSGTEQWYV